MTVFADRLRCLLLVVAIGLPAFGATPPAAKNVTVAQLDQLVAQLRNENDAKAARELADLRLTERASFSQLSHWETNLTGRRSRMALLALVDASAFLASPFSEVATAPPPDETAQREMLARVSDYVTKAAQKLPDFLATRETVSFAVASESQMTTQFDMSRLRDVPLVKQRDMQMLGTAETSGGQNARLYLLGSISQTVAYRDGKEVAEGAGAAGTAAAKSPFAMTSAGEFGQVLSGLFRETIAQDISWDHWEEGSAGRLAVFHYSVPRERSRFQLQLAADKAPDYPAHRGEFAADPASGAILRISIVAQVQEGLGQREAGVLVEFGPTEIGGRSYVCTLHSVAIARYFDMFADLNRRPQPIPIETSLNDVSFTNYRVFGSTSRVVTDSKRP